MSVTIRIGFIGIDGSSIGLAAEPTTSASAVIFSAVDQLRKFFEAHPSKSSPAWHALFEELGEANVRDAQEYYYHHKNEDESSRPPKPRTHAKKVLARKISLFSSSTQKYIPGYETTVKTVEELFLMQQKQHNNINTNNNDPTSSSYSFFWMDLTDPPCRIHITFTPPKHYFKNSSQQERAASFSEIIDQTPNVVTWTVEKAIQRVVEKIGTSYLHPHNLVCYVVEQNNNNQNNNNPLPRNRQIVELFSSTSSRFIHLDVQVANPPSCTVRVVDASVAEHATRLLYAKMGYSCAPNENNDDSYINEESYSFFNQDEIDNPYAVDPMLLVDSHSKRTISLCHNSSIQWSSTLAEIYRETNRLIHPLKGKGFLCLNQGLILRTSQAASRGDYQTASNLKLATTGHINGSQIPVFSPALTLRQLARMTIDAPNSSSTSNSRMMMSMPGEVQLYIVVNQKEDKHKKDPPKIISTRKVHSNDILYEADDVRFQLLDVLYPAANTTNTATTGRAGAHHQQRLKKNNVIPGSPEDSHFHQIQMQRSMNDSRRNQGVSFALEDGHQSSPFRQQQNNENSSMFISSPPPDFFYDDNNNTTNINNNSLATTTTASFAKPTSPVHREGTEAFVSIPSSLSASGGEVIRLLLPDGYFPLRRLKRFLKMQAEENGVSLVQQQQDFKIQFGTKVLEDDDQDVKNYVNPQTNIVFLNAF